MILDGDAFDECLVWKQLKQSFFVSNEFMSIARHILGIMNNRKDDDPHSDIHTMSLEQHNSEFFGQSLVPLFAGLCHTWLL